MGESKWWYSTASGLIGGFCCLYAGAPSHCRDLSPFSRSFSFSVGQPFDTIKVRLQTQVPGMPLRFSGPLDCLYKTVRNEGFRALYRVCACFLPTVLLTSTLLRARRPV